MYIFSGTARHRDAQVGSTSSKYLYPQESKIFWTPSGPENDQNSNTEKCLEWMCPERMKNALNEGALSGTVGPTAPERAHSFKTSECLSKNRQFPRKYRGQKRFVLIYRRARPCPHCQPLSIYLHKIFRAGAPALHQLTFYLSFYL